MFASKVASFFDQVQAAAAVSAAVKDHRRPRRSDLRRLGIENFETFNK